jgi:hypothetical protein
MSNGAVMPRFKFKLSDYTLYCLFDDDGVPRYIGACCKPVFRFREHRRNHEWLKAEVIIADNLSRTRAIEYEIAWIKALGRQVLGTGPLLNVHKGGQTNSIAARSKMSTSQSTRRWHETRARINAARKGNYGMFEVVEPTTTKHS